MRLPAFSLGKYLSAFHSRSSTAASAPARHTARTFRRVVPKLAEPLRKRINSMYDSQTYKLYNTKENVDATKEFDSVEPVDDGHAHL